MIDIKNIVRQNILTLDPYSSARDEFSGSDGVFLDANENPFGELNRYPDPYQKVLKQKLSERKNVPVENIFIGNGSDEVIDLAFRIFCNPGKDKALTFSPSYGMYNVSAAINDVELLKLPLTEEFQIDIENIGDILKNPLLKIIFICSPNNPTGNLMDNAAIETILKKFNGIVIIDEAYIDFSASNSWLENINRYHNLVVIQTFSKAWGLAAARVGVAYANSEVIELLNKVKPPYNVSGLNQKAAIDALSNSSKYESDRLTILKEKEKLVLVFKEMDVVKKIYPSEANFLLIEVTDADQIYQELVTKKLITRNRNQLIKNCLRISVGTPVENNQLVNALNTMMI